MASVYTLYINTEMGPVQVLWCMLGNNPKIETLFSPSGTRTPLYHCDITAQLSVTATKMPEDLNGLTHTMGAKPTVSAVYSLSNFDVGNSNARMLRSIYNMMNCNHDDFMFEHNGQILLRRKNGQLQVEKRLESGWKRNGFPFIPVPCDFIELPELD